MNLIGSLELPLGQMLKLKLKLNAKLIVGTIVALRLTIVLPMN